MHAYHLVTSPFLLIQTKDSGEKGTLSVEVLKVESSVSALVRYTTLVAQQFEVTLVFSTSECATEVKWGTHLKPALFQKPIF